MENKQNIKDLIQKFYPHAKEKLGFDHPVRVIMRQDAENAQQSLGKTAYYDPAEKLIVLYVTDRHPKDVLRSFSHELVHHAQNCRGELDDLTTGGHYAKDGKGREIEEEAYLQGNLNLRDYEDNIKFEGVNEMKLTKSQLKGLIEQTIEAIVTEKKFPDLTGDGKVTQADILKGRGVKLKEKEHENDSALDDDGFDAFRDAFKSVTGGEKDSEKEKNRDRFRAAARAAERTKEMRRKNSMEEGDNQQPPEEEPSFDSGPGEDESEESLQKYAQDMIDALDGVLKKDVELDIEDDEEIPELPSGESMDFDEAHCGGNRDDEDMNLKESKKQVVTETPQQTKEVKESNKAWYDTSLYNKLKSKWTK